MRIMNSMIRLSDQYGSATAIIKRFNKKSVIILALSMLMSVFIISCEEEPTIIGEGILPGSDFYSIAGTDTMSVEMYTVFTDSATSGGAYLSYLGSTIDPYFGLTTSDFVSQLWLDLAWPGDGFVVDSVKLGLSITDVFDEMPDGNTLNLWEIGEKLSTDSAYYINKTVPVKELLASVEIPSLPAGTDTVLTLDLPVSFGNYMLRDTSLLYLRSDTTDFRDFFYGLYFEYPQENNNHLLELAVKGSSTTIEVYYTNSSGGSRVYRFLMNEKCISYNRFIHDYEMGDPQKRIQYINEPVKDTLAYIQSMKGVYTKLVIPELEHIRSLPDIAVNKARLYLPVYLNELDYTEEMVPKRLYVRYDSAGYKKTLNDYDINPAFIDGTFNNVTNQYVLNISSFVQDYYEGNIIEPELELFLPEVSPIFIIRHLKRNLGELSPTEIMTLARENSNKRLLIKANRDTDDAVRFELTYTVLD